MDMRLSFLGAAHNVTGSSYCLEANGLRLLVDCGLYQERELQGRNWEPFPVRPDTLDAVLLTHAHLDHSGLLPKLVRDGFSGRIVCTEATADIAQIMFLDSASIQEEDAELKRKRHERENRTGPHPELPLYTRADANKCIALLSPIGYGAPVALGDGITATFRDAGHVLGSAMIEVTVEQAEETRKVIFCGDIGRWNKPILRDPTLFSEADYVLVESTYGDTVHEDTETVGSRLAEIVNSTVRARGNVVVPSFALERSQEVLFHLNKLLLERRIPNIMVFLDSPMAVRITDVFEKHPDLYDRDMTKLVRSGHSPFDFPGLTLVRSREQSKAVNNITGSAVIIAGSGMCTGGRIKHHLTRNISRPECTILFVGYQAAGTLGRLLVNGVPEVRILGEQYQVSARIEAINGLSAHADRDELLRWLSGLKKPPRQVFVVHGEPETVPQFADFLREKTGWNITAPEYGDRVALE